MVFVRLRERDWAAHGRAALLDFPIGGVTGKASEQPEVVRLAGNEGSETARHKSLNWRYDLAGDCANGGAKSRSDNENVVAS